MITMARPDLTALEADYLATCLASTRLSAGPFVARFEAAMAAWCGTEYAVACSSGTTALHLALAALGVGPGDEVLVPALTFVATANAVAYCGARPVFVDIDPRTGTLDAPSCGRAFTERTVGMIPVHLYGHPADMTRLRHLADAQGLWLLEDAAEAHGARIRGQRVGSFGECAAFSFYGNKILSMGEGGCVTTNDEFLAARLRWLRGHAQDRAGEYEHSAIGYNYRLTDLQAAIGLAQVERADALLAQRATLAAHYTTLLADVPVDLPFTLRECDRAWWVYPIHLRAGYEVPAVRAYLAAVGIETRPMFVPLPTLRLYPNASAGLWPAAERWAHDGLLLPLHTGMTPTDVETVVGALRAALQATASGRTPELPAPERTSWNMDAWLAWELERA